MPLPAAVAEEFRACAHLLEPAFDEDEEGEILNDLLLNRAQLWRTKNAALITQLVKAPEPYALVWKAGGRLKELMGLQHTLESWARQQGVRVARLNGRMGWVRVMGKVGFSPDGDDLRKAL